MSKPQKIWEINQLFLFLGMLSIVFAALKFASGIVVPLLIAISIAIILSPLFQLLERYRVPRVISLILVLVVSGIFIASVGAYAANELKAFIENAPALAQSLEKELVSLVSKLHESSIPIDTEDLGRLFQPTNVAGILQRMLSELGSQLSNMMLIIFVAAFILTDAAGYRMRLEKMYAARDRDLGPVIEIIDKIKTYFLIKAQVSAVTGFCVFLVLWYFDIQYAFLWATMTFAMNFIPVIGSIIAAVPPILFALVDHSMVTALLVTGWYAGINMVIGNIIEPQLMGRGLGLSTLTVFFSMTFWGWMFGPTGMILSVPLTMAFQFLLLQYEETKWAGFLLSDYKGEKDDG